MKQEECCPKFQPDKWEKKIHKWEQKSFVMERIPTFFHMPFPPMIASKIKKMMNLIEASKMEYPVKDEALVLFRDPSPFRSEIYISTSGEVSAANNCRISGTFISAVFEGAFNMVPKFIKKMDADLKADGKKALDYYIHYAYCPECAKKYKANYMIIFALVEK